jgi:hypothetical protein
MNAKQKRDALLYNLKPGEREALRAFQNNTDPITGEELRPNANLDHCHKTGLVRGLLNPWTNKSLIDSVTTLQAMLAYLTDPPAPKALGETVYGLIGRAQRKKRMRYGPGGNIKPHVRLHEK